MLKRVFSRVCEFLTTDKMPVWLSLLLVLGGALVSYYIAPVINEKFEMQAARREFLVKNLEQFSVDVKLLLDMVAKGVNSESKDDLQKVVMEVNPFISKIQFSVTQMSFLLPNDAPLLVKFQASLERLQADFEGYTFGADSAKIIVSVKETMVLSITVYRALLDRAGLSDESVKPAPPMPN
jgi:hypothetical protein